jgi:hypothetical protein
MRQRDVVLGQVYAIKVSGRIQPVRLIAEIRSAAKLRARLEKDGEQWQPVQQPQPDSEDQEFQQELTDRGVPY